MATPNAPQETGVTKFAPKRPKRAVFTDPFLKGLKPATRAEIRYEVLDAGTKHQLYPGFGIRVSTRRKVFFLAYRRNGRRRRYTIGTFPQVSLADARGRALAVRQDTDYDPAREKAVRRAAPTFRELADQFRARYVDTDKIRPSTAEGYRRHLRTLTSHFGEEKLSDVTAELIEDFRDERASTPVGTNRALEVLSRLFSWGRENRELRAFLPANPCAGMKALDEEPQNRVLKRDELRAVLVVANTLPPVQRDAVWWLSLHGCRASDVYLRTVRRGVRWDDLDVEAHEWKLPTTKTKPRIVPLTAAALRAVKRAEAYRSGEFVFPVRWDSLAAAVRKETSQPFAPKDIRTTVATEMQRLHVLPDIIDRVQGREPLGPSVRPIYQQYAYLDEQREALERWQRHLLSLAPEPRSRRGRKKPA
jgi:hypothetical protein